MSKSVASWVFYDFANSLVSVVVSFYFGLYFVDTLGLSDIWISVVSVVSTLFLLFILPRFGARADKYGLHKKYLTITSVFISISAVALGISMSLPSSGLKALFFVIFFYFFFQVLFQAALTFYTSFLKGIARENEDKIAGIGNGLGQLGSFFGLAIGLLIVTKEVHLSFLSPIGLVFVVNAILFLIIYSFLQKGFIQERADVRDSFFQLSLVESLKKVIGNKNIFYYLVAFLLYSDSILTLNLFISLYMKKAGGLNESDITVLGLVGLASGIVGAFLTPWVSKKIGGQKKTMIVYIISFGILLVLFSFCRTYTQFLISIIFSGLLFGLLFSLSVSMYTRLIPRREEAEYFSFYVLFSRFASLIGPPIWSLTAYVFAGVGDDKYRFSVISLAILVFLSLLFMRKVEEGPVTKT